jgi:hypothetical protein
VLRLDVTFLTAGTDILLLAIVVLPLGFAAILWAWHAIAPVDCAAIGADEKTVCKARADQSAPDNDNEHIGRDIIDNPSSRRAAYSN